MNIINTILILFIIIIIINNLTNKNILTTITSYVNSLKNKFYNNNDNAEVLSFDTILNKLVVKTNKPNNNLEFIQASKYMINILEKKLLKVLNNHFNKYNYTFYDIIINDNIEYSTTIDGKYFKPFNFSVKVNYKNKKTDNLFLKTEIFVKKDTNLIVVLNIFKENNNINTDILTENNDNQNMYPYFIENDVENNNDNLMYSNNRNFNNMFIQNDNLPYTTVETENSLIPNEINITATERSYTTSS